jgi:hypothetical protein
MYQLFCDGEKPPEPPPITTERTRSVWGSGGKDARFLRKLEGLLGKMNERDRRLLLGVAQKAALSERKTRINLRRWTRAAELEMLIEDKT